MANGAVATGNAQTVQVETTAYSFGDNQGSNNSKISAPVIHKEASGDGTYANPTTLAVPGHAGSGMQTPKGTRVYFSKYRFYGIVEDSGATPKKLRRFDIWSDGRGNSGASACMDKLTGTSTAILNPPAGKPVTYSGPRSDSKGCHAA
jgi:3D (Asp-Asp-Asp) domain-containing protein